MNDPTGVLSGMPGCLSRVSEPAKFCFSSDVGGVPSPLDGEAARLPLKAPAGDEYAFDITARRAHEVFLRGAVPD